MPPRSTTSCTSVSAYSSAEIHQMELKLLNTLSFNFSRPLPLHFLCPGDVDVLQNTTVAKYLVVISLLEYDIAHSPPSLMAAAALFLSIEDPVTPCNPVNCEPSCGDEAGRVKC
jgi:hypothetical protein